MGSWLSVTIFAIVVLVQVVAAIAQKGAKEKQKQRMREVAEQRRREVAARQGARPAPPDSGRAVMEATPESARPGGRQDLAARRKAQLEELRRRRAGRGPSPTRASVGKAPGQAAPQRPARMTPKPTPTPPKPEIRTVRADLRGVREAEERARRERHPEQARQPRPARKARQGRQVRRQRQAAPTPPPIPEPQPTRRRGAVPSSGAHGTVRPTSEGEIGRGREATQRRAHHVAALRSQLQDRAVLRDLFLLKEMLDPPVSMREQHLA
jgi:hypothetical protein